MQSPQAMPPKRRQVLAAARAVFGELGYEGASVDLIALRAGVSKATIYNHFEDKKALFVAAVVDATESMSASLASCLERPAGDVEEVLRSIGEKVTTLWLTPEVSKLYRQAIAEAERLPELGRMVFERGTLALEDAVASQLTRLADAGALRLEDAPRDAAAAFIALCHADLVTRMRLGVLEDAPEQIRRSVARAVRIFVRAHRA